MHTSRQTPLFLLPDVTPGVILWVALLFFLLTTTRPKYRGEITVVLPSACSYEGCTLWDARELYIKLIIKDSTHIYLQYTDKEKPTQTLAFGSVAQMNECLKKYLPEAVQKHGKKEVLIVIKANKDTRSREFFSMLEVLHVQGFRKHVLLVEPKPCPEESNHTVKEGVA